MGNFNGLCDHCSEGSLHLVEDKSYSKDGVVWRYTNRKFNKKVSVREGSWFSGSHLLLEQIVKLTYYCVYDLPNHFISRELRIGSDHTVVDWPKNFSREVCLSILKLDNDRGPDRTVEIGESKFGKRKYHRSKRADGVWVFGGIERETKKCFCEVVEDRSANTLIPIIKKYILPGTTILSDCLKAFSSTESYGYQHLTVNHSIELKNKETGACTNTIESIWNAVKKSLPKTGTVKSLYDSYLIEYCIRKKYLQNTDDKLTTFLDLVKRVSPVKKKKEKKEPH